MSASKVDLPEPLLPAMPKMEPGRAATETPLSTDVPPYVAHIDLGTARSAPRIDRLDHGLLVEDGKHPLARRKRLLQPRTQARQRKHRTKRAHEQHQGAQHGGERDLLEIQQMQSDDGKHEVEHPYHNRHHGLVDARARLEPSLAVGKLAAATKELLSAQAGDPILHGLGEAP